MDSVLRYNRTNIQQWFAPACISTGSVTKAHTKEVLRWTTVYHQWGCIMPHKDPAVAQEYRHERYMRRRGQTKEYYKEYRDAHRDERSAYSKLYYIKNQEKLKKNEKQRTQLIRLEVLTYYGGKCAFCGDSNPNHLSIDHINNNGAEHRRELWGGRASGSKIYRWLQKNNYPKGFQVLCHTHNAEKGYYGTMTPAEFDHE